MAERNGIRAGPDRSTSLTDGATNERLRANGYALLDARLDRGVVDQLAALHRRVVEADGHDRSGAFLPSMTIARADLRMQMWDGVGSLTRAALLPLFRSGTTEVVGGSFVSKPGSPNSVRDPHQDPTVYDESRFVSLSVWVPLTDSDTSNGTVHVLPGSHRMGNHVRPPEVASLDDEVRAVALRDAVPVEVEAGQLLVIDGAVIHHSPANGSGAERVAAICALRPVGGEMRLVRSQGGSPVGTADVHEVGVGFYRSGDLRDPDLRGSRLVGRVPYRPASSDDLRASLASR